MCLGRLGGLSLGITHAQPMCETFETHVVPNLGVLQVPGLALGQDLALALGEAPAFALGRLLCRCR